MFKLLLVIAIVMVFGSIVLYNGKILVALSKSRVRSEGLFYKLLGNRMKRWNIRVERSSNLKKGSMKYKINNYLKDIIANLGMSRDDVTPVGLMTFITSVSFSVALFYVFWSGETALLLPAFCAVFYFVVVVFRFMSLMRYERREAEIMDTQDLIAMDVKGGVYNAIVRYRKSFHPNIKPYFDEFIDNVQNKGYGFRAAMLLMNDKLGSNFTDFAQKAILYEEKADKDMDDIFSSVIEVNRYKRMLRYENNQKFNNLRLEFMISIGVIAFYGLFSVWTDPFLSNFFKNTFFGKFLVIVDLVAVTGVLAYISSIKSKFL